MKKGFKLLAIALTLCIISVGHCNAKEQTNEWQHYKHEWYYENFLKDDVDNAVEARHSTHEEQLGNGAMNACCGGAHFAVVDDVTGEVLEIKACEFYERTGRCYLTADEWYNRLMNDSTGYWHVYFLEHGYREQFMNDDRFSVIFGNAGETDLTEGEQLEIINSNN